LRNKLPGVLARNLLCRRKSLRFNAGVQTVANVASGTAEKATVVDGQQAAAPLLNGESCHVRDRCVSRAMNCNK
jgi:hypothetical protein